MKQLVPVSVVVLSAALAAMTWYATLMPYWAVQSGHRDSHTFYSQGMGLWLNYTEHVGDPTFDPGNSLWIPPQESAVHTYTMQCQETRAFCVHAIGDLHIQYCEVVKVYCGPATTFLQVAMSILSGTALLGIVWAVGLVITTRRTIIEYYLMQLCIFNGLSFLVVATVWYFLFFRKVLGTAFYRDQYTRCSENPTHRTCWHISTCVYLLVLAAVLYPMLSVIVATAVTNKFKSFQQRLKKLYERTTAVELPTQQQPLDTRDENVQRDANAKRSAYSASTGITTSSRGGTELNAAADARPLAPLQKVTSTVSSIDVHDIEGIQVLSDDEEEKARDDAIKYGESREFVVTSPSRQAQASEDEEADAKHTTASRQSKTMKTVNSIEF